MSNKTKGVGVYIYGKHALSEALSHRPTAVRKVYFGASMDDASLRALVKKHNIPVGELSEKKMPGGVSPDAAHQGVIAVVSTEDFVVSYESFVSNLNQTPDTALVLLGEVQDPHNVGAIIRSSAAFGISGVLIPEHRQAPVNGTVVKVSAGMAFRVPLVQIGNVNHTIEDLKKRGFWVYGLAGEGAQPIDKEQFDRPSVFVLGNESTGIREKTREACDALLSIPMNPKCESLNVAASAAVSFYAWGRQHPNALK